MASTRFAESGEIAKTALDSLAKIHWPTSSTTPVVLLRRGSERFSATREVKHAVADVNQALHVVSLLQAQIQEIHDSLHSRKTSLMQCLSPASGLPDELLSSIFDLTRDASPPMKLGAPPTEIWHLAVQLSHVCRRWRAIATASRKLWASITVRSPLSGNLIPLFAQRSGTLHLAVSFLPRSNEPWRPANANTPITPLEDHLVREVVLGARSSHLAFGNSFIPRSREAEPLDSITIKYSVDVNELERFSSARTLQVENGPVYGYSQLYMPRLEEIVLRRVSIDQIPRIVGSFNAPNLRDLEIINGQQFNDGDDEDLPDEISPDFSTLRSLRIINTVADQWPRVQNIINSANGSVLSGINHLELTTYPYLPTHASMHLLFSSFAWHTPAMVPGDHRRP
ncbi:hypothetical protein DL93DRAFT_2099682 [Clavulina sp. PMI_390]|nr:hypothetical protein DL93DRAFT_2099682 [Clavulina sp. PMI_390]